MLPMPQPKRLRRLFAVALSVGCWLLGFSGARAQIDFRAGSLLDAPTEVGYALPAVMSPSAEILPPTTAQPFLGGQSADATPALQLPVAPPDFAYHFGGKGRAYYVNDQRIEFTGM